MTKLLVDLDLLEELKEYMDNKADVDWEDEKQVPNYEAKLLVLLDDLLRKYYRQSPKQPNPEPVEQEGSRAYEVYCKEYSQIVHATSLIQAVKIFESVSGRRDVIFAEDVEYAKEERRTAELQSLKQSDAVEWKEVIVKRINHFSVNHHAYEAKELHAALNTILRLVPPELFTLK